MNRSTAGGLFLWFVCLAVLGTLIGAGFGHPWIGFAIGAGVFVLIILFILALAAMFFGGIIFFFDSITGKRR